LEDYSWHWYTYDFYKHGWNHIMIFWAPSKWFKIIGEQFIVSNIIAPISISFQNRVQIFKSSMMHVVVYLIVSNVTSCILWQKY
jgi:hypothetical protein